MCFSGYAFGRQRTRLSNKGRFDSFSHCCGMYVAVWIGLSAFGVLLVWLLLEPFVFKAFFINTILMDVVTDRSILNITYGLVMDKARGGAAFVVDASNELSGLIDIYRELIFKVHFVRNGLVLVVGCVSGLWVYFSLSSHIPVQKRLDRIIYGILALCATIVIFITIGIVLSLFFDAARFFSFVNIGDFLFGLTWSPQRMSVPLEDGSVDASAFGAIPLFWGTIFISFIAMVIAVPIGLFSAIYMVEYASSSVRTVVKPTLEILAGIPTVVYGYFAAIVVAPHIKSWSLWELLNVGVSSESALAAGLVMGIMIIPFVSSLSDDIINVVPQSLRDGSLSLGATKSETIKKVVIPVAFPGIMGAVILAMSRAVGEVMIVMMAAGLRGNLTANPLDSVTTVTVQIVKLLTGDQIFDSPKTLSAFALGLTLFVVTLIFNVIALRIVHKYREQYD